MSCFSNIRSAVKDIQAGKMVVVVDDEDRENEGDLVVAAEKVSAEIINFMSKYGRGLICMPIERERLDELNIPQMVQDNTDNHKTAFTVSIDAMDTTTGISAYERAHTILKVLNENSKPSDFKKPGHIFPLEAKEGGVLVRAGHTEASVDLAKIAGLYPAGVICEIMNEDGTMAKGEALIHFAQKHGLKIITIADLIAYRRKTEQMVERMAECNLDTKYGNFKLIGYQNILNEEQHVALVKGDISDNEPVLVRVHSECLTGDAFGSIRCDCGEQFSVAMQEIEKAKKGVLVYMRQEGRGIGLINKIKAYQLQDEGLDTVEANLALGFPEDMREYGIGAQILADLGVKKIRLMTNNPKKISGLQGYDLEVVERVAIKINPNKKNQFYIATKKEKLGHIL